MAAAPADPFCAAPIGPQAPAPDTAARNSDRGLRTFAQDRSARPPRWHLPGPELQPVCHRCRQGWPWRRSAPKRLVHGVCSQLANTGSGAARATGVDFGSVPQAGTDAHCRDAGGLQQPTGGDPQQAPCSSNCPTSRSSGKPRPARYDAPANAGKPARTTTGRHAARPADRHDDGPALGWPLGTGRCSTGRTPRRSPLHCPPGHHSPTTPLAARTLRRYHGQRTRPAAVLPAHPCRPAKPAGACSRNCCQSRFYQRLRVELQLGYAVFSTVRQIEGRRRPAVRGAVAERQPGADPRATSQSSCGKAAQITQAHEPWPGNPAPSAWPTPTLPNGPGCHLEQQQPGRLERLAGHPRNRQTDLEASCSSLTPRSMQAAPWLSPTLGLANGPAPGCPGKPEIVTSACNGSFRIINRQAQIILSKIAQSHFWNISGPGGGLYVVAEQTPTHLERSNSMWTKPAYTDLRIGFEVTMYFASR